MEAEDGLWYQEGGNWQPIEGFGEGWKGIYETKDGILWIGSEDGLWHQDGNGWQICLEVEDIDAIEKQLTGNGIKTRGKKTVPIIAGKSGARTQQESIWNFTSIQR